MEHQEDLITIISEDGTETLFEILLTFALDEYNKEYVCVTPIGNEDEEENDEEVADIFVFSFKPDEDGEQGELEEVVDEAEWASCEEVINAFMDAEELADEE